MFARSLATALLLALGLTGPAGAPLARVEAASPTPIFFVTGHGWGHGVGLGQYGAYGLAQHGWTYDKIATHYYAGTTIGSAPLSKVRVLLAPAATAASVSSKLPFQVTDGNGVKHPLDAGAYTFGPRFKLKLQSGESQQALPGPLVFSPGATALALNGRGYRGTLQFTRQGSTLIVVNTVALDLYLRGVVPSEMPKSWSPEALKAQAVVARSYALAHLHRGGGFDLYPDTRSQVYGGVGAEAPETNDAVTATAGKVVLYKGHVADTLFFSSSGGRTASTQDVFTTSPGVPYLVSVPDPYDTISPYHNWGPVKVSAKRLASALGTAGRLSDVSTVAASSGRVRTVTATLSTGEASASGSAVKAALGLRSTWFRVGVLALSAPPAPVPYGAAAQLKGIARGISSVQLQQRNADRWKTVATLAPIDGSVTPLVRPKASGSYRLVFGSIPSSAVSLSVAALVHLRVPADQSGFWGTVRPLFPGQTVQVQRQVGTTWRLVRAATVSQDGTFTVSMPVGSGTYRARFAPGRGLAAGVSLPVRIP